MGRPTPTKQKRNSTVRLVEKLRHDGQSLDAACKATGISRSTYYPTFTGHPVNVDLFGDSNPRVVLGPHFIIDSIERVGSEFRRIEVEESGCIIGREPLKLANC